MARSHPPQTWQRGFVEPADSPTPAWADAAYYETEDGERAHYAAPAGGEKPTSSVPNAFGLSSLRSWPSLYNGTEAVEAGEAQAKKPSEVDVLICGAGPFGLEVALSLARQGISFRIIDKASGPCHAGRADAIQPRSLEYLRAWGLVEEVLGEGPLLNKTALYRNGTQLFHGHSSMCDSRYRGISTITQGQVEKIYVRDLRRHGVLVERCSTVSEFDVARKEAAGATTATTSGANGESSGVDADALSSSHPVTARVTNARTGSDEVVRAKYLVGADGAASKIREMMGVPFDGLATDCFWTIMDVEVKTDYPHILDFGIVISTEHGGSIMIPREDGLTRFYVQITGEKAARIAAARRRHREKSSSVGDTEIYDHGITPEEGLEQLNKIMAPWTVEFAGPMSWFAVWRVNERVARYFSTPDQRVHIGGDAAHVHSVLGAFGLNSSIYDAANLSWKLGLCVRGAADPSRLLPTYDAERRLFANRVIRCSGAYLRFICNLADLPLAALRGQRGDALEAHDDEGSDLPRLDARGGDSDGGREWLRRFFARNAMFILGVDGPRVPTVLSPETPAPEVNGSGKTKLPQRPISIRNGARAPDPRVCFGAARAGRLYDALEGADKFHIVIFGSDLQGPVAARLAQLSREGFQPRSGGATTTPTPTPTPTPTSGGGMGFYAKFGGRARFNVVLVAKGLLVPREVDEALLAARGGDDDGLRGLREAVTTVACDDRQPDEDAHYWYGVNHARGAVVVVRPDLVVGMSAWPEDAAGAIDEYLSGFLIPDQV